jgi:hypothetical protein
MKPTAAYAAMSDPDLNRHFSRRWTAPIDDSDPPLMPQPRTLEDLPLELVTDWHGAPTRGLKC